MMQNTRMTLFLRDCLEIIDDKYDCTKDALDQAFTRFDYRRRVRSMLLHKLIRESFSFEWWMSEKQWQSS